MQRVFLAAVNGGGGYGWGWSVWWWFWVAIAVVVLIALWAYQYNSHRPSGTFTGAMPIDQSTAAQIDSLQRRIQQLEARVNALEQQQPPKV